MRKIGLLLGVLIFVAILAPAIQAEKSATLTLFWSVGCSHCGDEKEFLVELQEKYPQLEVIKHEVRFNATGQRLFIEAGEKYGFNPGSVPVTTIGDNYLIGFDNKEGLGKRIEEMVRAELDLNGNQTAGNILHIPFIGEVDLDNVSLPIFTVLLGLIDGFNPCAFFVLCFLLSLMIYAGSRKRILLIGLIFVFISGLVYFLFMSAWLNFFLIAGSIGIVTLIGGLIALALGLINLKDFFFFGRGISLVIPESKKPKLFSRMRDLVKSPTWISVIVGTIVLAIVANTYELLCTLGFPMVYTRALTLNNLEPFTYYLYLILYNIFYILPLTFIVLVFAVTLGSRKLTEEHGKLLKLLSGFMMLGLGLALIFSPDSLGNILVSGSIILLAVVLTLIVWASKKTTKSGGKNESR